MQSHFYELSKGGNLLLGIGPDKTGKLATEVYDRLNEIGQMNEFDQ